MKSFPSVLSAMIVVGVLSALGAFAKADMIFSEGFDTPALPNPSANYTSSNIGSFPEIATWSGDAKIYGSGNWLDPFSGSQYIVFNPSGAASSFPSTISWNSVPSNSGIYTLSWDYRIWSTGGTESLDIYINNVVVATFSDSGHEGSPGPQGPLESFSTNFVSTGGPSGPLTLKLIDTSTGDGNKNIAIDNIQINGPAAPEPASMALLAVGGLIVLRRRQ